jgi:SNF family Na+-dependent transporter
MKRESWSSKLGVILAVAGSAVGLGNFLRFPGVAVQNGGGAFLIPYFVCFLLLGIPMAWVEWTMGRYGGQWSHGSAPGIFNAMVKKPWAKYLGSIGIIGPLIIFFYYIWIESWTLGYSFFSLIGTYASAATTPETMKSFLSGYMSPASTGGFHGFGWAYLFFLVTFGLNFWIIYRGVVKGIELVNKIALPLLAVLGIILAVRVVFLGVQIPAHPEWNVLNGFGFLWNPDFKSLLSAKVWLAAAGQIFFTLSLGIGVILTYASYLDRKKDVALSSLTAASTNEFFEVIIGGSLVIPAAFVFFGPTGAQQAASAGTFTLGFVTMPLIFQTLPLGGIWGFFWFALLFLAGVTSSISILQPAISFLEDELKLTKKKAVFVLSAVCFVFSQFAVFSMAGLGEMDFWGGNLLLVVFAAIEIILFAWVFGIDKGWKELHVSADIRVPGFYKLVIKYVTPVLLVAILVFWAAQEGISTLMMKGVTGADRTVIIVVRLLFLALLATINVLIWRRWRRQTR